MWVLDSHFNQVPLQLISGVFYKKKIIIIENGKHSIQPNSICPAKSHDQLECPFPSLPSRMPKNGVWTFLSAPAPALKWTIVPASVILQQFISSCRQTLSFLLVPSTFFVLKTTADRQEYNKIKLYLLGRFGGRGKKGAGERKSPHPLLQWRHRRGDFSGPSWPAPLHARSPCCKEHRICQGGCRGDRALFFWRMLEL